jgi:hypothetical protein
MRFKVPKKVFITGTIILAALTTGSFVVYLQYNKYMDQQRLMAEHKLLEAERIVEEQRQEDERIAEENRLAEENRIIEEEKKAEELRVDGLIEDSIKDSERGNIESAINKLQLEYETNKDVRVSEAILDCKNINADLIIANVDSLVSMGDANEAVELLIDNRQYDVDDRFQVKASEIENEQRKHYIQRLEALKSNVSVHHDDISKMYYISMKGQDLQIDLTNKNIDVRLAYTPSSTETGNTYVLGIAIWAGFIQDDWMFLEEIIWACDEERFSWDIPSYERETEIFGGMVFEGYRCLGMQPYHSKYNDTSDLSVAEKLAREVVFENGTIINCADLLKAISESTDVTIRFRGDKGNVDCKITLSERNAIVSLWELYEILDFDISLFDKLLK